MAKYISKGNRCGHDRKICRQYVRPDNFKAPPKLITKTLEKLKLYFTDPSAFLMDLRTLF